MKKMKLVLAFAAAMIVSGCSGTFNLLENPAGIAQTQGVDAAIDWCDERDIDLGVVEGVKAVAGAAGLAFDVATLPVAVVPAILTGGEFLNYTTISRDKQCEALRKSGGDG